jgi:hypothetical protein
MQHRQRTGKGAKGQLSKKLRSFRDLCRERLADTFQPVAGVYANAEAHAEHPYYAPVIRTNTPAASISRLSHSGSISKPFGQVGAPSSRNTRAKYAGSRNGSPIGPLAASSAEKSCSPAVPSLNVACRRWPPRYLSLVTSIVIEFCERTPTPALPRKRERGRCRC